MGINDLKVGRMHGRYFFNFKTYEFKYGQF